MGARIIGILVLFLLYCPSSCAEQRFSVSHEWYSHHRHTGPTLSFYNPKSPYFYTAGLSMSGKLRPKKDVTRGELFIFADASFHPIHIRWWRSRSVDRDFSLRAGFGLGMRGEIAVETRFQKVVGHRVGEPHFSSSGGAYAHANAVIGMSHGQLTVRCSLDTEGRLIYSFALGGRF